MAFPTGWNRRVAITVPAAQVGSGGVSNFDVALTAACLPDEMRSPTDSNRAQSDGGDIRFSSDSAGTTQLACDIIRWEYDTTDGADDADILIRVNAPSLSSAGDTTIYAWYNTAGTESQPAAGASFGQHATYHSSIVGYWPLEEDPSGSAPQMLDRTSNANHGTSAGSMTSGDSVAAKLANGLDFDGSNDSVDCGNISTTTALAIEAWVQSNAAGGIAVSKRDNASTRFWELGFDINGFALFRVTADSNDFGQGSSDLRHASTMRYLAGTYTSGGTKATFVNGSSVSSTSLSGSAGNSDSVEIGRRGASSFESYWSGKIDEVRYSNVGRSAAYFTTRYNNENAPGTFAAPGTPEAANDVIGEATLVAIATATADGSTGDVLAVATLDAITTATADATASMEGSATLAGIATATAAGGFFVEATATLTAIATATADGSGTMEGDATLVGIATATADAEIFIVGIATLVGVMTITYGNDAVDVSAVAALPGIATATVTAQSLDVTGAATLPGIATATADGLGSLTGVATLPGISTATADGLVAITSTAALTGISTITVNASVVLEAEATLPGIATATANGSGMMTGAATMPGIATGTVEYTVTVPASATIDAISTASADAVATADLDATLIGIATAIVYMPKASLDAMHIDLVTSRPILTLEGITAGLP